MYTRKYIYSKKNIRWGCSNRTAFNCKGGMTTDTAVTTAMSSTPHSHHAQDQAVAVAKLHATLKELAPRSRGTLSQLMADQTTSAPVEIRAGLGNPDSVMGTCEAYAHEPSLSGLTLDGDWTTTIDGDQFLLHDSGEESDSRMQVFGTEQGLRRPASSDSWFMDGTF